MPPWFLSNTNGRSNIRLHDEKMQHLIDSIVVYSNSTITSAYRSAATGDCPTNCTRQNIQIYSVFWSPLTVTATVTAETVVQIVNSKNNRTRLSTITNTDAITSGYKKPQNVNAQGTQFTSLEVWNGFRSVNSTM